MPLPCIRSLLFPREQRSPGSARSRPGRETAKRTLDGEDQSGIIWRERKGTTRTALGGAPICLVPSLPAGINEDESDPLGPV